MSQYQKSCTTCKQQIESERNGNWLPYNQDGTFHDCRNQPVMAKIETNSKPASPEELDVRLRRVEKILFSEGK